MVEAPVGGEGPGERDQEADILGPETFGDEWQKKESNKPDHGSSCKPHSGGGPLIESAGTGPSTGLGHARSWDRPFNMLAVRRACDTDAESMYMRNGTCLHIQTYSYIFIRIHIYL